MKSDNHLNVNQKANCDYGWLKVLQVFRLASFTVVAIFLSHCKKIKIKDIKFEGRIERFPLAGGFLLTYLFKAVELHKQGTVLCSFSFHDSDVLFLMKIIGMYVCFLSSWMCFFD